MSESKPIVDQLFMLDATGSMESTLNAAVEYLEILANQLIHEFPETIFRFGCICYRDPVDSPKDIHEYFDFTRNVEDIIEFLKGIEAKGGKDRPEDIAGAFNLALNQSKFHWEKNSSRAITLISDAPPHGKKYYGKENHEEEVPVLDKALRDLANMDMNLLIISLNKGMEKAKKPIIKTMQDAGAAVEWKDLAIHKNEVPVKPVIESTPEEEVPFDPSLLTSSTTHASSLLRKKVDLSSSAPSTDYTISSELTQSRRHGPHFTSPVQTPSSFDEMTNTQLIGAELVASSMNNIIRSQSGTKK